MSMHDDNITVRQMLDYAVEAIEMAKGKTRVDIDNDRMLNLALTRLVEVVGEAARRVSSSLQQAHSEIPWPQIIATRNRLIHGYDVVDLDILWRIVTIELPALITGLKKIVPAEPEG